MVLDLHAYRGERRHPLRQKHMDLHAEDEKLYPELGSAVDGTSYAQGSWYLIWMPTPASAIASTYVTVKNHGRLLALALMAASGFREPDSSASLRASPPNEPRNWEGNGKAEPP